MYKIIFKLNEIFEFVFLIHIYGYDHIKMSHSNYKQQFFLEVLLPNLYNVASFKIMCLHDNAFNLIWKHVEWFELNIGKLRSPIVELVNNYRNCWTTTIHINKNIKNHKKTCRELGLIEPSSNLDLNHAIILS